MSSAVPSLLTRADIDRGIGHLRRGEFHAAVAVLSMALQAEPDAVHARLLRGRALARTGRHVEALADLDEAVRLAPRDISALAERGALHVAMGRITQALGDFHAAVLAGGTNANNYFQRGAALFNLAEWSKAAEDFSAVLGQSRSVPAWLYRGLCKRQLNDADGALADFTAALEAEPGNADAARERAKLLAVMGRTDAALVDATAWVKASPRDSDAYSLRGELHHRLGDDAKGLEDYRAAVQLSPIDPKALNRLAWILATSESDAIRNGPEAIEHAEKAADLTRRDDPLILDTLAAAQAECGDFLKATETIDEAIAFAPTELQPALTRHREIFERREKIRDRESISNPVR